MSEKINREDLPPLTHSQVETIVGFLRQCDYERHINYDGICCGSDGVDMGVEIILDKFREAYGIPVDLWEEGKDEGDDDE